MTYHQFTEALEKSVKEMAGCLLSVELCNNKKNNGIIRSGLVRRRFIWKVIMNSTSLEAR